MKELKIIAASALEALKNCGAECAAVEAEYIETREFNVDGGEFSLFRTMFDNSLSLSAMKAGKKGSAAINKFDDESIDSAAAACLAAAEAAEPDEAWEYGPGAGDRSFTDGAVEPDLEKLFSRCRELVDDIAADFPQIMVEQMIVEHKSAHSVYANTNGSCFEARRGWYELMLMFSGHEGDKSSSFFGCGFRTLDLDHPFIEQASLRRDLGDVERQIYPKPVEGKFTGTVILTPACLGDVLYYALSAFAEGSSVLNGTSIWKDKLGQQVADERLSISLAPGSDEIVCGAPWTSDGYISEDFDVIRDGRLCSFVMNKYFANRTGLSRSGNYKIQNIIIPAGEEPLAEIVGGIERGMLVSRVSGGAPGANGDFSMVAKNSFLIENGKVGEAVNEVMINGNLSEIFNNIRGISSEKEPDGGCSLPWMAFDGVTVSGK